jgi:hypothetical protein
MNARTLFGCLALTVAALISGCGSVPLASPEADTLAKLMQPVPDKAVIYLFRSEAYSAPWPIKVTLDGKDMGDTSAESYFRWVVPVGDHVIVSHTENAAGVILKAEPGHVYYVWQSIHMGMFRPRSELKLVDRVTAEIALRTCYLLEGKS